MKIAVHNMYSLETKLKEKFTTAIKGHESQLDFEEKRFKNIGNIKLVLVLLLAVALYFAVTNNFTIINIGLLVVIFLTLVLFWIRQFKSKEKIEYLKEIISLNNKHIDRITGEWVNFKDNGSEFVDSNHDYSGDLDIVGEKSLFQFLNTTNTWHGRNAFVNDLLSSNYSPPQLIKRQEAIRELSSSISFSNNILHKFSKIGLDLGTPKLIEYLKDNTPFLKSKPLRITIRILPILTLVLIAINFFILHSFIQVATLILVVVQMTLWAVGIVRANNYLRVMSSLPYKLGAYNEIIDYILDKESSDFSSEKLREIQEQLRSSATSIKALGGIAARISIKHNPLLYFLANILLLWDYQNSFALQIWKEKYHHSSEDWFIAIGELESLLSFSHLPNICNRVCLPTFIEGDRTINALELGHPLLPNDKRINNDFSFHENIVIISGSNMSGKTTFLRTIGVNMILARAGGFVCAKKMECTLLQIITSMRIADDLNQGISTFLAELRRIKKIIDSTESHPKILFLIDEIFRGTNSRDRMIGAKTVITRLSDINAVGLISTHDLELCELERKLHESEENEKENLSQHEHFAEDTEVSQEKGTIIKNAHFSEHYQNNEIYFDYKLKEGISNTSNARFLMKMVGIDISQEH